MPSNIEILRIREFQPKVGPLTPHKPPFKLINRHLGRCLNEFSLRCYEGIQISGAMLLEENVGIQIGGAILLEGNRGIHIGWAIFSERKKPFYASRVPFSLEESRGIHGEPMGTHGNP